MLEKTTHVVGSVRANKKNSLVQVLQAKLKREEIFSSEDQKEIVILKGKHTRDKKNIDNPPLASTSSAASTSRTNSPEPLHDSQDFDQEVPSILHDEATQATPKREKTLRKTKEKPMGVLAYNKGKSGVDLSDHMA
ncbi:hypothetical protein HHI36_015515 [Cryptolaemus montrouzieri]|uniref:Uncharacterized protein n=1 Tax=Cryptolaemus montrouzieri TaxID=559131 RepID=A0ABD2N741_9CUCU